jgi:hypothetical protein
MAKRVQLYRAYKFTGDKDPVIDKIHTMMEDEGVTSYYKAHELSGVSSSTIYNWIEGDTKRPQVKTNGAGHTEIKKKTGG